MMKKRLICLAFPIITLALEILPYGAVCNFAHPDDYGKIVRVRELYSYFDLVPFGYANFAPLLTAVLTCAILILLALYCFCGKKGIASTVKILLCVAIAFSLVPLLFGIDYFSIVGATITATLIGELWLLHFALKRRHFDEV